MRLKSSYNQGIVISRFKNNTIYYIEDAPSEVVWDVLREWVKEKPVSQKWLKPEFKVAEILNKASKIIVDFTEKYDLIFLVILIE